MLKYIAKRIILMVPVILGVSIIIFTIMSFTPGDPVFLYWAKVHQKKQLLN
jgi:peptide/nickel transport system permease protein